jgi:hypothetical protein
MAYFDGFSNALWLKRFRCPDCRCIVRMKPKGYFRRFQASIDVIRSSLSKRLTAGKWCTGRSTSRQRHWLSALRSNVAAVLGTGGQLMTGFDRLILMGIVPVSRGI